MTTSLKREKNPGPARPQAVAAGTDPVPRTLLVRTLALALVAGVGMLLFIVSPVVEHTARYNWSSAADGVSAGLPLNPYYPAELSVSVPCAAAQGPARTVLSTYPLDSTEAAGLRVGSDGQGVTVSSEGVPLSPSIAVPADCGTMVLTFTPAKTTVTVDGRSIATFGGDHRPRVTGFFTTARDADGLSASVAADTQFDTSSSLIKWILGALSLVAFALAIDGVRRIDGRRGRPVRAGVRHSLKRLTRLRAADVVVGVTLPVWAVIGPPTPDDGFITEIIQSRSASGLISNYTHWYNTPEAPFGWFYEIYAVWADVSHSTLWMRVPSVVIGLITWVFLSRVMMPRLIPALHRTPGTLPARIVLPVTFLLWWLPFGQGLRSETWLMIGVGLVVYLVDKACTERRYLPLCLAGLAAGLSLGIAPTGVIAFLPFLAALPRILRWMRDRPWLVLLTVAATGLAAFGAVVLLMFADQSLAAIMSGTRLRTAVGPNVPWQQEYLRYSRLLGSRDIEGTVARLAPIIVSAAAGVTVAAVLLRDRRIPGIRLSMLKLVLISYLLSFPALALTPTKLVHHFATAGLLGALLLTCVAYAASPAGVDGAGLRTPVRRSLLYAGGGLVFAVVFYGFNNSWLLSNLGLPFRESTPSVFGISLSTLSAAAGIFAAAVSLVMGLIRRPARRPDASTTAESGEGRDRAGGDRPARRLATVIALSLSACLLFETGSFVYALAVREHKYTLGEANLASLAGRRCGLSDDLLVESDVTAGVLGKGTPALADFDTAVPGSPLPAWQAPADRPATLVSGWFSLPSSVRSGELPLVIATHAVTAANTVSVEFRSPTATASVAVAPPPPLPGAALTDSRLDVSEVAPSSTEFRVVARSAVPAGASGLTVAAPRVPTGPSLQAFAGGSEVATNWLNAFFYPCLTQPETVDGRAEVAAFQLTTEDPNADGGNYNPLVTGAFAGVAPIIERVEIPVYLPGDPTLIVAHLFRFVPRYTKLLDHPVLRDVTRSGIAPTPPLLIPAGAAAGG